MGEMTMPEAEIHGASRSAEEILTEVSARLDEELSSARKSADRWKQLSRWMPLVAAAGSAFAGAAVSFTPDLDESWLRNAIILVAFTGTAISAAAAALRSPDEANKAERRAEELDSIARWVRIIDVDLYGLSTDQRSTELVRRALLILAKIDQIHGVEGAWSGTAPWVSSPLLPSGSTSGQDAALTSPG